MASQIAFTITTNSINLLMDGRMKTLPKGHVNFEKVEKILRKINQLENAPMSFMDAFRSRDAAIASAQNRLRDLVDIPRYVEKMSAGRVKVTDKGVLFNDAPLHNAVTETIMKLVNDGQSVAPLAHFLDRLMSNPTKGVREDLYAWIESGGLALTPDGCFLAFKKVDKNYQSIHRNPDGSAVDNTPGQKPSMPREEVDDNRDATCSRGLHFCSWSYLPQFGWGGEDKVVILKVGPEDVVAIPADYNRAKGRAWTYEVVGEVPEEECEGLFHERVVFGGQFGDPLAEVDNASSIEDAYPGIWDTDWPDLEDNERGLHLDIGTPFIENRLVAVPETSVSDTPPRYTDKSWYDAGFLHGKDDRSYGDISPAWTEETAEDDYDRGYVDGWNDKDDSDYEDSAYDYDPDASASDDEDDLGKLNGEHWYDAGYSDGHRAGRLGYTVTWTAETAEDDYDRGYVQGHADGKAEFDATQAEDYGSDIPGIEDAENEEQYARGYRWAFEDVFNCEGKMYSADNLDDVQFPEVAAGYMRGWDKAVLLATAEGWWPDITPYMGRSPNDWELKLNEHRRELKEQQPVPVYRDGKIVEYRFPDTE